MMKPKLFAYPRSRSALGIASVGLLVTALSAAATMADIDKGLAAGFDRYLTKPYDVRDLLTAVREQLLDNARG